MSIKLTPHEEKGILDVTFSLPGGEEILVRKDRSTGNVQIAAGVSQAMIAIGVGLGEKVLKLFADQDARRSVAESQ